MAISIGRREIVLALGGVAATWPLAARAQRASKIPKIGVLWHAGSEEEEATYLGALRQGFREIGHIEGKTFVLENRFPTNSLSECPVWLRNSSRFRSTYWLL
jgi:putative tryptophan/tyrosine transport system substrate-binding protein